MTELEALIRKRGSAKAALTNFTKFVETLAAKPELGKAEFIQLQDRIARIEKAFSDFQEIQSEIEAKVEENSLIKQFDERYKNEDLFYDWIAKGKELVDTYETKNVSNNDNDADSVHSRSATASSSGLPQNNLNTVKLPTITLPKFQGNYQGWLEFRDTFESLIHTNESLSEIQKFHYLRASLEGSAAVVIKSVEFTSSSYSVAWDTLCERYNNNKLLVHNHVKALFGLESIQKESSARIRKLIDDMSKNLRALEQLKQSTANWDTLIIFLIVSKLDNITIREWENYSIKLTELPVLQDLKTFLKGRADLLETIEYKNQERVEYSRDYNKKHFSNQNVSRSLVASTYSCNYCQKGHSIYSCPEFANLSIEQRLDFVRKSRLCTNCLRLGHNSRQCKIGPCRKCKAWHNSLLHIDKENSSDKNQESSKSGTQEQSITCTSGIIGTGSGQVFLSTALVKVFSKSGQVHNARLLLDSASQSCYITTKLCNILGLDKNKVNVLVSGISNKSIPISEMCNVKIQSLYSNFKAKLSCLVINEFTSSLPSEQVDISSLNIPLDICLADPEFYKPNEVDLLVGAELFWTLIGSSQISCGKYGPTICETKLGWVVSGAMGKSESKNKRHSSCHLSTLESVNLNHILSKFWELEEANASKPLSKEELFCEENFIKTTTRNQEGRFIVTMPLKESPECLGKSRSYAEKSFYSLERRLSKNESLRDLYVKFMREYLDLGHMSLDNKYPEAEVEYFASHHGVLKEESVTSKLRVVFNCSASTSNGLSLNNIQHTGPVLQDDLLGIVLRFRCHAYVFSSDVAKMYRAVLITPEQRQLQKIFWRENASEDLKPYVLNTVTYGQTASSFLAIRCLFELANDCSDPEIARVIKRDMYVDDLLSGAPSCEQAEAICQKIIKVFQNGGFDLRKWRSNDARVLKTITDSFSRDKILEFAPDKVSKTLGLTWSSESDSLIYNINLPDSNFYTKRMVLSTIAKVFDPLGLLAATTILAKMLMQKLWVEKISWDARLPDHLLSIWIKLKNELPLLNNFSVPRHVVCQDLHTIELHGFCDASQSAYGACIYLRSVNKDGEVQVRLLCAKSKVAPVKSLCTIPKLELCAALLLSRLADKVNKSLDIKFECCVFWSDSTITLSWIRTSPSLLKVFVGNRVSEIQSLTNEKEWRYVPSQDNPADHVSRGLYPSQLIKCKSWFYGPEWLQLGNTHWPKTDSSKIQSLPELKPPVLTSLVSSKNSKAWFPFERFSNFSRMVRVMAFILRFRSKLKNKIKTFPSYLTLSELETAKIKLCKLSQQESFYEEIDILSKNQMIDKKSKLYRLSAFLDSDNILRVGGRLKHSDLPLGQKHPMLINSKHKFTYLLFEYEHKVSLHCGPQFLLSNVRYQYWPIGGRNLARVTVKKCMKCARFNPILIQPKMSNLPKERITPSSSFSITGLDYAGPFLVRDRRCRGAKLVKCWVGLFICFATKALHLELISSLSTDAFLMALRRFAARRGKPVKLFSDNGSNFVGAKRELGKFFKESGNQVCSLAVSEKIEWSFIPPYSPHFGGLWEAGVKSVKYHLKRVLGNAHFTYEEFTTALTQIEAVLNSRPLCPLTSDPSDLTPLTPAHFLIGRPLVAVPDKDVVDIPVNRLTRFQLVQRVTQHFWRRWKNSYLAELQYRNRWQDNQGQLAVSDLVLIKDDHSPPSEWRLGRIETLHKGSDGIARVASIRTSSGVVKRSFNRLCVLPVEIPLDFKAGGMLTPNTN